MTLLSRIGFFRPATPPPRTCQRARCLVGLMLACLAPAVAAPRVRIGIENNRTGSLSFVDERGRLSGFTSDLLEAMTKTGEIEFEIVAGPWGFILGEFQAGRIDVLANVAITEDRLATMDFSISHAYMHGVVYFRPGRPAPRRSADLAGKKFGVLSGTLEHFNAVKHQGWSGTIVPFSSVNGLFDSLARGDCDLAVFTRRLSNKSIKDLGLRSEFLDDVVHRFHFGVHKGDSATLARLNEALANVRQNGSFDRIYDRWIGPIEPHPIRLVDLRPYFLPAAAILLGVGLVIWWQRHMLAQRAIQAAVLRETEERYHGLVDSAFDGSVIDQEGLIKTVNTAYAEMFGYAVNELIGKPVLELYAPEVRERVGAVIAAGQKGPYESVGLRKDGTCITIETAGKVCTYQGKPARIAAVRDITGRKVAEEAIRGLNAELEQRVRERTAELARRVAEVERLNAEQQTLMRSLSISQEAADQSAARLQEVNANLLSANQELDAFSYSVSHVLRAPLRNISGFIELLRKRTAGKLDAESDRFTVTVMSEAERMGALISDLLTFSHIGRTNLRMEPMQMAELVDEVKLELHQELVGRVIEWRVGPLPAVQGDRILLRQVVSNLVGNAVKFTRHRPAAVIEIGASTVRPDDPTVTLFIRDNGAGFNPKYLDKLFRVFQRLHNSREFEGTGIGLANVKRIITRHRGRVWAEGQVDRGATFYFTLRPAERTDRSSP